MRLVRLPWLALAFAVGAGAVELTRATVPADLAMWMAGAGLVLALALESPAVRARMVLALACAGALRMGVARLDVERAPRLPAGVIADDRALDTLVGTVRGPVEEVSGQRAFLLGIERARGPDARVWVTARGGQAGPVLPGDRVRVHGRLRTPRGYRVPGALDVRRLAAIRDAHLTLATREVEVLGAEPSAWRWPGRLQRWAARQVDRPGRDREAAAAARAMITGDEGGLDEAGSQRFRDAGVAHVLSVSGLHLAVVALLGFAAVRRGWASVPALAARVEPARMGALVAAPVAIGFTMMTGGEVATVRALLVVLVVLAGAATTRRARVIDALGAAGLAILAVQPFALFDPSFQLSFAAAATLALAMGGRPGAGDAGSAGSAGFWPSAWPRARAAVRRLMRALRALRGLAWASLWITMTTAPLTALAFGTVPTGGLLANLPVIPLTELVIVPLGILGLGLAAVWSTAGALVLDLAVAASGWVVDIAGATAQIAPVLTLPPPNAVELAACGLVWAAAIAGVRGVWPGRTALAIATLGALVIAGSCVITSRLAPGWRDELVVTFLDVGQGDAAVLELPGGAVWMIDSGGLPFVSDAAGLSPAERQRLAEAPGARSVVPFLAARRIGRIDTLVISHPHPDHYEGLRAVARAVEIGELWLAREALPGREPGAVDRENGFEALVRELEANGTRVVHPLLDAPFARGGVVMTALAPRYLDGVASADPVLGINDNSLVVRIDFAGRMILFAGDIEHEAETLLHARHGRSLRADVVKVPHHGSATSSTPGLVHATAPALAVISCGVLNRFGFPDARVMARWRAMGTTVLRTDEVGAITVEIEPGGAMRAATFDWP